MKSEERACRVPPPPSPLLSSPAPTPAASRPSSRFSSAPLYSRSSSSFSSTSSSPRVSLFAILPCRSLSTYSPRSYQARVLFFRLSSSCVALSGAALQKTNQRPTDRFYRAIWKIFRRPDRFSIIIRRVGELRPLRTGSGGNLGRVLTYTSSCVQMNVVVCACVSYGHACTHQDFIHKFQNNDVSVSLR